MQRAKSKEQGAKCEKVKKACALCSMLHALFLFSACATTKDLPAPPPKYVHQVEREEKFSTNSLWRDTASLYEDVKARRLNDLVTIKVVENITGSGKADTNTSKQSSLDVGVDKFLGAPLNLNLDNFYGKGYTFSPEVAGSAQSDFKGSGETTREGKLVGTITAKVVEVMPNNNLVLEARKEITINNEKQILILKGMIRPDDIEVDNTVLSTRIADAQVFFVGDGIIQDKQGQGWLVKILDNIWPF
ncbi:MAG: flagellar basal body L-ring protein FlgH [Nitrospirota bacterium]